MCMKLSLCCANNIKIFLTTKIFNNTRHIAGVDAHPPGPVSAIGRCYRCCASSRLKEEQRWMKASSHPPGTVH